MFALRRRRLGDSHSPPLGGDDFDDGDERGFSDRETCRVFEKRQKDVRRVPKAVAQPKAVTGVGIYDGGRRGRRGCREGWFSEMGGEGGEE